MLFACGFTPTLKMSTGSKPTDKIHYIIKSESYLSRQALNTIIENSKKSEAKYVAHIQINESQSAVNIESTGSVVEYRIEIEINYAVEHIASDNLIYESKSRGFANYDVSNSEYSNTLVKNEALKTALNEAAQLMNIMIRSEISK